MRYLTFILASLCLAFPASASIVRYDFTAEGLLDSSITASGFLTYDSSLVGTIVGGTAVFSGDIGEFGFVTPALSGNGELAGIDIGNFVNPPVDSLIFGGPGLALSLLSTNTELVEFSLPDESLVLDDFSETGLRLGQERFILTSLQGSIVPEPALAALLLLGLGILAFRRNAKLICAVSLALSMPQMASAIHVQIRPNPEAGTVAPANSFDVFLVMDERDAIFSADVFLVSDAGIFTDVFGRSDTDPSWAKQSEFVGEFLGAVTGIRRGGQGLVFGGTSLVNGIGPFDPGDEFPLGSFVIDAPNGTAIRLASDRIYIINNAQGNIVNLDGFRPSPGDVLAIVPEPALGLLLPVALLGVGYRRFKTLQ